MHFVRFNFLNYFDQLNCFIHLRYIVQFVHLNYFATLPRQLVNQLS